MEVFARSDSFVERIDEALRRCGIDQVELGMMDHICYRVETDGRYEALRDEFATQAALIDENDVAGRLIAIFEPAEPLTVRNWRIPYIELPAPKARSPYPEGWEHAEFVTIGDVGKLAARHPHLPFERAGSRINQTLSLKLGTLSVKFHELPLGAVVRIEQRFAAERNA